MNPPVTRHLPSPLRRMGTARPGRGLQAIGGLLITAGLLTGCHRLLASREAGG